MLRLFFTLGVIFCCFAGYGQKTARNLSYYIEFAKTSSPLLHDYKGRIEIQQMEEQRLKAVYIRSKLELNGEFLFVPIISKDGGKTSFLWNAQNGTDYYGYDLGESSGHLHAGFTWTQPLLGRGLYEASRKQTEIQAAIQSNNMRLEKHQLERTVTEQYLLCLLDKSLVGLADSVRRVLQQQELIVQELVQDGILRQSDLHLLAIEKAANYDLKTASWQSYCTHLSDLNILCGITDTAKVELDAVCLFPEIKNNPISLFLEQYRLDSLNVAANLRVFKLQYKPRLNLFVNGGLQVSNYTHVYRHLGWNAGLTFSWTIFDGRQKRWQEQQMQVQMRTISAYKAHERFQNEEHKKKCLSEMQLYGERLNALCGQLSEYDTVLVNYLKEIRAGQRSVVDYITVLRNKIQAERDYVTLQTNRQLLIAAYNYWNW